MRPTYEQSWELLRRYNKEPFHLQHALTVSGVMEEMAKLLGYEEEKEFWSIVGLLHDLDFEMYPEEHCVKVQEIMMAEDIDDQIIHACASHGYGIAVDVKPEHEMEKVLFAVDELTGLIGAAAKMRPSKSVQDMELKSLMKKYKSPSFAAGCSRQIIEQGADMLHWPLEELVERTIQAMRVHEEAINQKMDEIRLESGESA